jgi:RNA recognition motif-containing protein
MTKKLFVGNLSYNSTNESLTSAFSDFGNVQDVKIIIDRITNKSKGFAFINMSTDAEARQAISSLNGADVDGRKIVVSEAKEMEPRERSSSFASNKRW